MLALRTFGGLSIEHDGASCSGAATRQKTLALLALLAAAGKKGLRRDKLIGYLWSDADTAHGRHLLKQACYALRQDLHAPDLLVGRAELRLNPAVVWSDIQAFEEAVQHGDLARTVALYAGPFLDGFYVDGAGEFEHWVDAQRERLTRQACTTLETLANEARGRSDHRAAGDWWRRLAALEPLSSRAAVGVMTALAALGESAEALRYGRAYEAFVRQELGTTPEPAVGAVMGRLHQEPSAAEGLSAEDLRLAGGAGERRRTVGYERERAALRAGLQAAVAGRGLMLCVAGEPGSGKTTLVEDFVGEVVASGRPCHIACGRCSERLAGSGAYLPLLDALEGLLRADARGVVARLLREVAPNWYAQVAPALEPTTPHARAPAAVQAASQERLKRELNAFLREVCRLRPLILFLDDVHWVDASTIDILSYLANQMSTAQIVIVTTCRPSEIQLAKHPFGPLKLDLQTRGICREVTLDLLTRADIEQFLALEFPGHRFPPAFGQFVHAKTEGSPLFMVDLLSYLRAKQVIVAENGGWTLGGALPDLARDLPESVRSMIERKIEQLADADHQLLAAAAVQGYECDAPIVAEVLGTHPVAVEERLDALERIHGFVRRLGEHQFPDGTLAASYCFVHGLYQNALYAGLTPTRRATLSRAVAEALLAHYGDRSAEVAAEVALLFEAARDLKRAVEYFAAAAERAAQLHAHREAVALAKRGLGLLHNLPDTLERTRLELALQLRLSFSVQVTAGYADPEAGAGMSRARAICHQLEDSPHLFAAVYGLWLFYLNTGQMPATREFAEQLVRLADATGDPALLFGAHGALGTALHYLGELVPAQEHLDRAFAVYDHARRVRYCALYGLNIGALVGSELTRTSWLLGYPARALRTLDQTLALGRESDPAGQAVTISCVSVHQLRREPQETEERATACIAVCDEHGVWSPRKWASIQRGWAVAQRGAVDEGIVQMRENLGALRAVRQLVCFPHFLGMLADALAQAGRIEEGLDAVQEGLEMVAATHQRFYEAELRRLRGELLLRGRGDRTTAEACFREALAIAGRQQAKSLELRAAMSLGRLWQQQGKQDDARALLAPIYGWFTEGFDTPDLQDAKALLDALE
jgi:DNA-binding SARP family transcriptional activator/predicted ATPase